MGLWVPPVTWDAYESNIATPVIGTTVTAGGTANTKNTTYTELLASTSFDAYAVEIMFSNVATDGANTSMLVDIAIGAAASETVIIPNLNAGAAIGHNSVTLGGQRYWFPLYIPAGSRLSATAAAAIASDTASVTVRLWGNPSSPVWAGTEVIDYGTTGASSKGTPVTPGNSGAEGAWTQIVASTTRNHYYLAAGVGNNERTSVQDSIALLDVGVGAATEDPIMEDYRISAGVNEQFMQDLIGIFVQVPAASRLTARISQAQSAGGSYDVILYGIG